MIIPIDEDDLRELVTKEINDVIDDIYFWTDVERLEKAIDNIMTGAKQLT